MAQAALTAIKWAITAIIVAAVLAVVGLVAWGFSAVVPQIASVLEAVGAFLPPFFSVAIWALLAAVTLPFAVRIAAKIISLF